MVSPGPSSLMRPNTAEPTLVVTWPARTITPCCPGSAVPSNHAASAPGKWSMSADALLGTAATGTLDQGRSIATGAVASGGGRGPLATTSVPAVDVEIADPGETCGAPPVVN